jgi:hypothetical protein
MCKREGLLTDMQTDSFYEETVLKQKDASPEQVKTMRRRFEFFVRLYSRCYRLPGFLGKIAEKLVDIGILAATSQRVARASDRIFGRRSRKDAGPCYTIEEGEVKVHR